MSGNMHTIALAVASLQFACDTLELVGEVDVGGVHVTSLQCT